jgi:hypothetical protein
MQRKVQMSDILDPLTTLALASSARTKFTLLTVLLPSNLQPHRKQMVKNHFKKRDFDAESACVFHALCVKISLKGGFRSEKCAFYWGNLTWHRSC